MSPRWALLSFFLIGSALWSSKALALPACPGQRFYLTSAETLEIEFNRKPGCDAKFFTVERGTVDRKLFYPSGKTDERRVTARDRDVPEAWSELPQRASIKATGDSLVKFLAETPPQKAPEP